MLLLLHQSLPGPVIGADIEGWTSLRDGTYTVDVPTCILGPTQAAHVKFYSFLDEGQVSCRSGER